jgi:hypothetical protein
VNLPVTATGRRRWRWFALGAVALGSPGAQAEQWTIDNSFATRYESNDNTALAPVSPGTMNTLSLSTALAASRKTENSATRVNASVASLREQGPGAQSHVDGQLGLAQSLSDPLNSFTLGTQYQQDFNDGIANADIVVGRGRRRTRTASGGWSRSLAERLSANVQLSEERTAYGLSASNAVDYRNTVLSTGLSYRLTEADTLSLDANRSDYRTDTNRSTTDQISLGWSRVLTERNSLSLSLGVYRTQTETLRSHRVCPLAASFCDVGFVQFIVVTESVGTTGQGLQFSVSDRHQLDETTDVSFGAARQQVPSGAGVVVRSDTLNASLNRSFSPLLNGTVGYAQTRSTYLGLAGEPARPAQQNLSISLARQLATDLSLQAGYQFSHAEGAAAGQGGRSHSVNVSLKFDWPKFDAAR